MLTIAIAVLGLVVSAISLYSSNIQKAEPGVLIGSQISAYPVPYLEREGVMWGGVGFYVPMTFFNWGPNGGSIIECRITISKQSDPDKIFDMGWYEFAEMLQQERQMGYGGFAQPLPLPPRSSLTKTILFVWQKSETGLEIAPGKYNLNVLIWTKAKTAPDIRDPFQFTITDEMANDFGYYLQNQKPMTIDIPIRETNRRNDVLTQEELKKAYNV